MFRNIFNKGVSREVKKEPEKVKEPRPVKSKPKKSGKAVTMIPILSWRTVTVVAIGLILGVLIALGYWIISPSLSVSSQTTSSTGGDGGGTGLIGLLGIEPEGPYQSVVRIQVVSPGSEYMPLRNLQQMGEYYSAKTNSLPFYEFLSQRLDEQMPEFTYDVDTLSRMIYTQYDYSSELPIIKITVTAATEREAIGLAGLIPEDFREYLTFEEKEKQQKDYDATLQEIDSVKTALYEAQKELNEFNPEEVLSTNPEYLAMQTKVSALQQLLDSQASQLISQTIQGTDLTSEYNQTLQELDTVTTKYDAAKQELENLKQQENSSNEDTSIIILNATINGLQAELDKIMTGYTQLEGNTQVRITGLAEMIAIGDTASNDYISKVKRVETISKSLAEAKKELNDLQNQNQGDLNMDPDILVAQIKVDTYNAQLTTLQDKVRQLYEQIFASEQGGDQTELQSVIDKTSAALADAKKEMENLERELGYDRLAIDLEYKIAQDKVTNLNARLESLTEQLGSLVGNNNGASETDYLVAGNPTSPTPLLPERGRARNTLLMGAIAGMVIAWGVLNYKWIAKGMPSSGPTKPEGDGGTE